MSKAKSMFEKASAIAVIIFLFYHLVWVNIGTQFLFSFQKLYYSFWDFVKSKEGFTALGFIGFVLLAIFLILWIFEDEIDEEKQEKKDDKKKERAKIIGIGEAKNQQS